jgi:multidrug efflux system membrane fusion protein
MNHSPESVSVSQPPQESKSSQTPRPKASFAWILWVLLAVAVGVGGYFLFKRLQSGMQAQATTRPDMSGRGAPVVVAAAKRGDVPIYVEGLGTVTPFYTVTIHTRVDGELQTSLVEGQLVHQGDVLAQIDPKPYAAAVEQAAGTLARDQALLDNANLDLNRYTSAVAGTYTPQQIDTQKALVGQYDGLVKSDQGNLDAAKVQLQYCTIIAPITGRIGLRNVDLGNIVHATDTNGLATITQLQPIAVVFTLPQDDIPQVLNKNNLRVEAWDEWDKNQLATGTLEAVDSVVDPTSASIHLKAKFDNLDNALFPSQFVNAKILVDTQRNKVIVPAAAVQQGPDGAFVYVVGSDQSVEVRPVTTGSRIDDNQALESGLDVGEIVVTDGVDRLTPGMKVTPRMMAATQPSGMGASTRPYGRGGRGRRGGSTQPSATQSSPRIDE